MTAHLGMIRPGSTLYIPFDTYAGATGASVTLTGLAVTDIEVFKNGSVTQRASDTGYTLLDTDGIDFDAITGIHGFSIDLSSNATADFFTAGAFYWVVVSAVTIDSQTVNFTAATFQIGYPDAVLNTTIATLASQTSFTLTAGPAEDDALNGCIIVIHDIASSVQLGYALISDYTGSTRTVTLVAGTTFTAAAGDNFSAFKPALLPTVAGRTLDVSSTGEAGLDWANVGTPGSTVGLSATTVATVTTAATATNVTTVNGLASGVITATSIAADAITAAKIADGAIDAATLATGAITAAKFAAGAIDAAALASDAVTEIRSVVSGTSDSGSTTTMVDSARTESDTDYWAGAIILFTSGNIAGEARIITAFNAATDTITFTPATTQAVATQTYEILPNALAILAAVTHTSARIPNVTLTDTVTTYTGNTAQTGDAYARIGAPVGASISADIAGVQSDTDNLQTRIPAALVSGRMDSSVGAMATDTLTSAALAADAVTEIQSGLSTLNAAGVRSAVGLASANLDTQLTAIDDFLDTEIAAIITTLGTPAGASISADIAAVEAQTDDIGAAGAGLTAIPWNASWDAEVQSEVTDALVAASLTSLVLATGTADSGSTTTMVDAARTEGDNDYWKGRLLVFTSGTIAGQCAIITDFVAATDTFTFAPPLTQAVSTQNYIILPGVSAWDDTLAEHLISGSTGAALNAAGAAGDPWSTALPGAYGAGTAGLIVGTNLDATVGSRASASALTTVSGLVDDLEGRLTATRAGYLDNLSAGAVALQSSVDSLEAGVIVTTNNDKTGYALTAAERTSIATALLVLDLSTITGEAARSVLNAVRFLRNRWTLVGTTLTVYEEDDTTTAWTSVATVNAAADPVTGSDPT